MWPEAHWSCIAHFSAEDMLKSAVIEEKKTYPLGRGRQPIRAKIFYVNGEASSLCTCFYGHVLQV